MTTHIPDRKPLIEKSLDYFSSEKTAVPLLVRKGSSDRVDSTMDLAIPLCVASSQLMGFLSTYRIMRYVGEDSFHFYVKFSPTFEFALMLTIDCDKYTWEHFSDIMFIHEKQKASILNMNGWKNPRSPDEEVRFNIDLSTIEKRNEQINKIKARFFESMQLFAERASNCYLKQLEFYAVDFVEARDFIAETLLPKLSKLEVLRLPHWSYRSPTRQNAQDFSEFTVTEDADLNFVFPNCSSRTHHQKQNCVHHQIIPRAFAPHRNTLVQLELPYRGELDEFAAILGNTSPQCFRKLIIINGSLVGLMNRKLIQNVVAKFCPRLSTLRIRNVHIDTGFFKAFSGFTLGLQEFSVNEAKISSRDKNEFYYLQRYHGHSLQMLELHSVEVENEDDEDIHRDEDDDVSDTVFSQTTAVSSEQSSSSYLAALMKQEDGTTLAFFPCLTTLRISVAGEGFIDGKDDYGLFSSATIPNIRQLSLSQDYFQALPWNKKTALSFFSHSHLVTILTPSAGLGVTFDSIESTDDVNEIFNNIGNTCVLLEFLNVFFRFPLISHEDFSDSVTFDGFKNLKQLKRLTIFRFNDHLLKIAGDNWGENFESLILNSGVYIDRVSPSSHDLVTDGGLLQLANITRRTSTKRQSASPLRDIDLSFLTNVTDEGFSKMFRALAENGQASNYHGLNKIDFRRSKNVGAQTMEALAECFPNSLTSLQVRETSVGVESFPAIAKLNSLQVLCLDGRVTSEGDFKIIAENLKGLHFLDVDGVIGVTRTNAFLGMFQHQFTHNEFYLYGGADPTAEDD